MKLQTYERFTDQDLADSLVAILKEHDIPYVVQEHHNGLDSTYGDVAFRCVFEVKVRGCRHQ
jgi:hypothetical protein